MPRSNYSKGGKGAREGDMGGKSGAGKAKSKGGSGKGSIKNGAQMLAAIKRSGRK